MDLIIGGAYQGKLDFAKSRFKIADSNIVTCTEETAPKFDAPCLNHLEQFALYCVKNGINPAQELEHHHAEWQNSVLICCDIFCGVVPTDATMRAWREATGRMCAYLSRKAKSVTRVFCGLEQKLK